ARGVLSVLAALHVLGGTEASEIAPQPAARTAGPPVARSSRWLRAPKSGIFRPLVRLGDRVARGQAVATLTDPFGEPLATVEAPGHGAVIGIRRLPLACEGDALLHLAAFDEPGSLPARLGAELDGAPADG
ncbi:MAG: succinylglutamate desuccinylase, partial [Deltaproteobacteria bacterium]